MKRIYEALLIEHHRENRQMAFFVGPRQVGKTTTCKGAFAHTTYINWDNSTDRMLITKGSLAVAEYAGLTELRASKRPILFDEIHKYPKWKDFLKGFFDVYADAATITVTGSAKLDAYKKGGDSLMGRYFFYHMHPLSVAELISSQMTEQEIRAPKKISSKDFDTLLHFGGFPEPFLKANTRFANRWKRLREDQLIREDIRNLTRISETDQVHMLARLIAARAGQLVNYSSLANELNVSVNSVRHWITALKSLYFCFEVKPWFSNISRSLKKQPKLYLWDWSNAVDGGARHENFVASHLLKAIHWWTDIGLGTYGLYYVRDKNQREVDFVVTRNSKPWFIVEVKTSRKAGISESLHHFQKQTGASHAFQVVFDMDYVDADCFKHSQPVIVPAATLLSQLI